MASVVGVHACHMCPSKLPMGLGLNTSIYFGTSVECWPHTLITNLENFHHKYSPEIFLINIPQKYSVQINLITLHWSNTITHYCIYQIFTMLIYLHQHVSMAAWNSRRHATTGIQYICQAAYIHIYFYHRCISRLAFHSCRHAGIGT